MREVVVEAGGGPALVLRGGLLMLAAIADRWGYEEDGPRTTVWADFPIGE